MNTFFCALRVDGQAITKPELFAQIARLPRNVEWQSSLSGPFLAVTLNRRHTIRPLVARGKACVAVGDVRLDRLELMR